MNNNNNNNEEEEEEKMKKKNDEKGKQKEQRRRKGKKKLRKIIRGEYQTSAARHTKLTCTGLRVVTISTRTGKQNRQQVW